MKRTLKSAKSRAGCATCKARRIKCDERKPGCGQCIATSRPCPGYTAQLRWSSKHEVFPTHSRMSSVSRQSPPSIEHEIENGAPERSMCHSGNKEVTDIGSSPELDPGLDNGMHDIHPSIGFFDDVFDLSPSYVEDISWSMRPAGMFDEWSSGGPLPSFAGDLSGVVGHGHIQTRSINDLPRTEGIAQHHRLDTPISPPTVKSKVHASAETQNPSTSLLGTFYRLSSPNLVPSFSEQDLVSYFQHEVCPLLSVFDSDQNPFQTIVTELGATSRTVNLAMQSMAVGHLTNHYPYLAPTGLSKRWQAWRSLQQDLAAYRRDRLSLEKILVSILLLGPTSVWHPGPSQGPQYLLIARNIMQKHLQDRNQHTTSLIHEDFFQNCLVYWEQSMSFVDPTVTMPSFPGFGAPELRITTPILPIHPHPWTGVSPEVHFATAEVGRILRRRQRFRKGHPYHESESGWAKSLEAYLYALKFPGMDDISDLGDQNTSKNDLIQVAEAYRLFGLIELYALYPDLLSKRLEAPASFKTLGIDPRVYEQTRDACWLTQIALHMIDTIKAVPISSGASRGMVAILVSVSSYLRLMDGEQGADSDQILSARYFVESSLLNMARKYAQRPAIQATDLVKEVWARLDSGAAGEHWMTVAHEKGWLGFLG